MLSEWFVHDLRRKDNMDNNNSIAIDETMRSSAYSASTKSAACAVDRNEQQSSCSSGRHPNLLRHILSAEAMGLRSSVGLTQGPLINLAEKPASLKRFIAVTHATTETANAAAEVKKDSKAMKANKGKGYHR